MKTRFFVMALAVAVLAVSCKEKPVTPEPGPDTPSGGTAELKVTLPSDGPLGVYVWSEYDEFRVGGSYYGIKSGAGTRTAVFDGTPAKDSYYMLAYPSDITGTDRYLSYNLEGQYQKANGSVEHLIPTVLIEDATTWEDITLSEAWAKAHGGSFRTNGVIAFDLKLPADAGELESLTLESAGVKFPVNNSGDKTADNLTLMLTGVKPGTASLKAFLSVSEKSVEIPATQGVKLTVTGDNTYSVMLPQAVKMGGGILTEIKVTDASAWTGSSAMKGAGTEASPYILKTPQDVEQMYALMESAKTIWFELGNDIDMASVVNWLPLNVADPYDRAVHFDGKGHTIKNFKCEDQYYSSFFGVLNGTCKNVTFEDAVSRHTETGSSGSMGIVAGYAGASNGASASVENVHVKNGLISSAATPSGTFPLGGLFGTIVNTAVKGCSFEGTIQNDVYATGTNPDRNATGGIAGKVNGACSISDCTSAGTITSTKSRYTGGIAGWVSPSEDIPIMDCTNTATVTGGVDRAGGIVGHYQQGTVLRCVNKGAISSDMSGSVSGTGGILGYTGPATILDCVNEGNVSGTKNSVGGIVGYTEMVASIERCVSIGEIESAGGRFVGGIVGGMKIAGSTVRNCWSSGKVVAYGDQEAGGIVGSMMTGQTVSCCYSTAEVQAQRVAAGIVARACNNGWAFSAQANGGNTIEKCIAWNPSVKAATDGDVNTSGGSGAVVGFTNFYNTLNGGWRHPAMVFKACDTVNNVLVDQPDCSPSNPYVMGSTPGTSGKYGCPYHGKAAATAATVSSLARELGWDAAVWDFSKDLPTLK